MSKRPHKGPGFFEGGGGGGGFRLSIKEVGPEELVGRGIFAFWLVIYFEICQN